MSATARDEDEDLEALFDRLVAEREAQGTVAAGRMPAEPANECVAAGGSADNAAMFQRIGQLTRALHDSLRELGYDRKVAQAAQSLPDARDRLAYIARLSGEAAERVLSSVERARAACGDIETAATPLAARWERLYAGALSVEEFKALAADTRGFLATLPTRTAKANSALLDIMMAQDFHDLTGQVIQRVGAIAHTLEKDLLAVLIETCPPDARPADGFLAGPAMPGRESAEVVAGQEQVDQLLESLGF